MRVWTEWAASQLEACLDSGESGASGRGHRQQMGTLPELLCFGDSYILFDDHWGFFGGRCVELANRIEPGYR